MAISPGYAPGTGISASPYVANQPSEGLTENKVPAAIDSPRERRPTVIRQEDTDDTTYFYNVNRDKVGPLTPQAESRLIRKNFLCLLSQTWWISFLIHLDRATLSSASIMGIFRDINMSKNQFNQVFTLFYVGYLIALWPGAWLSQKVGHKRFITGSLFLWALLIGVHPAVKTGKQLMALRFILGLVSCYFVASQYLKLLGYLKKS